MGISCSDQKQYDSALKYLQKTYLHYSVAKSKYLVAEMLNELGSVYLMTGKFAAAIEKYSEALQINRDIHNKFGMAQNHVNLAACYQKTV